jgi:hypothetical protein
MQNSVSPSEFQAAHYASAKITSALSALKALDKQSLGYDDAAWAETQAFMALLDQIRAKNQSEIDASNAAVTGLKAEAEAIQTFLADAPRFDVELLCGTTLYPDHDPITEAAA